MRKLVFIIMMVCIVLQVSYGTACSEDKKVFVLVYHTFLDNKSSPYDISVNELTSQLEFFKSRGFQFVSYSDISKDTIIGNKNILISIDDGNVSLYKVYYDVFKPLKIKPLIAIYPGVIGAGKNSLNWNQVQELSSEGCEIASHGYDHLPLKNKLYENNKNAFIKEIHTSKEMLDKKLSTKISLFVYPNGVRSETAKKIVKDSGYTYAFSIRWGPLLCPLTMNKDPYDLPRYMIEKSNWGMISSIIIRSSEKKTDAMK